MQINWDAVSGISSVITLFYLYFQFHYLPKKARKEALFHLQVLFGLSKAKVQSLLDAMTFYYVNNKCENDEFLPGVTFKSQALELHHLIINDLNDEKLEGMIKVATSDVLIATAADGINKQVYEITKLEGYFNAAYRFKDI